MNDSSQKGRRRAARSRTDMTRNPDALHRQLVEVVDVLPDGIALFDADDRYVFWNRQYSEIYKPIAGAIAIGARFEDVVRAALEKGLILEAVGREEEWLAERLADHRQALHIHEHHMSDGRWLRVQERCTSDGGRVSVRTDITELKQREASFRLLFESNPIPMFVIEANTKAFLAVNQAAVSHYGFTATQFSKMSVYDLRRPEE